MNKHTIDMTSLQDISLNAFAYELLREELLPDLIGSELDAILYWAGRNLARKYPLDTIEEVIHFFEKAGWGSLSIIEHKRREMHFHLTSPLITERQKQKRHSSYQLETGFVAEQIQKQRNVVAESYEEQKKRSDSITFLVKWDVKDPVEV
ncbi:YslB family protein [Bacillus sp. DX1.1]|uniref:YslB family protein n=1 Tax=unclassified Bacillus (in: firmicutes) TaxID=185979 RepID=UPI0025709EA0|nr:MULTISPECIES: YslB family protein [unclassified Bacillus (in: firmicutes)]MDM5156692.1 YslB family protein [Bacillus sp. DX1.1]WJE80947.1 YslB family protein [Bacillus sp. DX3.1]